MLQHGGTPNLSKEVRAIPHPGTFWAPWFRQGELTRNLPHEVWEQLSERGKEITRMVVAPKGSKIDIPWKPDWLQNPGGSGGNAKHTGERVAKI